MIRYGRNGRVSGLYLVKNIIQDQLIRIPENGIVYDGKHHRIRDLEFSEVLKKEKELKDHIRKLTEDTVRFLYFMEEDEALRVPGTVLSVENNENKEDITAISLLSYFACGGARLILNQNRAAVLITEDLNESIPGIKELLRSFIERAASFSEDELTDVSVLQKDNGKYETSEIYEGIHITAKAKDQVASEVKEEKTVTDPSEEPLSDREKIIRKNFETEMRKIASVIESLEENRVENWTERKLPNIQVLLPESAAEDSENPGVFQIRKPEAKISFLEFDENEHLSERVLTESSDDGSEENILVRTNGGVQHILIQFAPSEDLSKEQTDIFIDRIIRSIKWLQK